MNSEELEQSLRTEFENYLRNVVAEMRQEVSEFQKKVDAELAKHKSQMDDVFHDLYGRLNAEKQIEEVFKETVVEHLRLARDEGARITAAAIAEAEELEKQHAAAEDASVVVVGIRDAIRDISSNNTQSSILKSLVSHAAAFTPRGAFFIVKNEHFVGWRVFGNEGTADDQSVREVFFPVGNETILSHAITELGTVDGAYGKFADDSMFLNRLHFGQPDRMYAIPLVVRERAVAVLYADYGNEGEKVNVEALETLVRVAGLTVEISASARTQRQQAEHEPDETTASFEAPQAEPAEFAAVPASVNGFDESAEAEAVDYREPADFEPQTMPETVSEPAAFAETVTEDFHAPVEYSDFESQPVSEHPQIESDTFAFTPSESLEDTPEESAPSGFETFERDETPSTWAEPVSLDEYYSQPVTEFEEPANEPAADRFETVSEPFPSPAAESDFSAPAVAEYEFETVAPTSAAVEFEAPAQSFDVPASFQADEFSPVTSSPAFESAPVAEAVAVETIAEAAPKPSTRSRLSERNVDLPIEVSDDERRLHNDARRFARLLVSEIRLYNEQKVKEGRDAGDLYERLREAIDRSREMYDKRVQPPVAAKFDYFHYELVSSLAEGDEGKLGPSYPRKTI